MKTFQEATKGFKLESIYSQDLDTCIESIYNEIISGKKNHYYLNGKDSQSLSELKSNTDNFKISIIYRLFDYIQACREMEKKFRRNQETVRIRISFVQEIFKFLKTLFPFLNLQYKPNFSYFYSNPFFESKTVFTKILEALIKTKISFNETQILKLLDRFFFDEQDSFSLPYKYFLDQVNGYIEEGGPSQELEQFIRRMVRNPKLYLASNDPRRKDEFKISVQEILAKLQTGSTKIYWAEDEIGNLIYVDTEEMETRERKILYELFSICKKAKGGKPTEKFLEKIRVLANELRTGTYAAKLKYYFQLYSNFENKKETHTYFYLNQVRTNEIYKEISPVNSDILKSLIWSSCLVADEELIQSIAKVAEKAYKKIPGKGPVNPSIGNACFYSLAKLGTIESLSLLSTLKYKIKNNHALKLINKYMKEVGEKSGLTLRKMEDVAVNDFGLSDGKKEITVGEYISKIIITNTKNVNIHWYNNLGKEMKSLPKSFKEKFKTEIKKIRNEKETINKTLVAQKERLDRSYLYSRVWEYSEFKKNFLNHGLMGTITKSFIWSFEKDSKSQSLFWLENHWVNASGEKIIPSENSKIRLWHPVGEGLEEVLEWREFIMKHEIRQAFKQAFREVYILTEAELRTRSYSNRMAAHIIKQHQFTNLAKMRGWKYSLLGAFDNGANHFSAETEIPEHGLKAQFYINEILIDESWNDSGILNFVGTDQVRFLDANNSEVDLVNVPIIIFSEIMRDVDLFVGVCSVGNDLQWSDSGNISQVQRDYWHTYSFGDLGESAKIRKQVLENILPKLKIGNVCELKDKYLIVKGKIRTYKIHIGSSNILMEPNDQYLCIVPDRKNTNSENFYLPFEGDQVLSNVISKAFLLASDHKITDETIVRQLRNSLLSSILS